MCTASGLMYGLDVLLEIRDHPNRGFCFNYSRRAAYDQSEAGNAVNEMTMAEWLGEAGAASGRLRTVKKGRNRLGFLSKRSLRSMQSIN